VTTRTRSQDLTADLLHDLAEEEAAPVAVVAPPGEHQPAVSTPAAVIPPARDDGAGGSPTPFVETSFFLAPRSWLRPGVARSGSTVSLSAGPVRLRLGRR